MSSKSKNHSPSLSDDDGLKRFDKYLNDPDRKKYKSQPRGFSPYLQSAHNYNDEKKKKKKN